MVAAATISAHLAKPKRPHFDLVLPQALPHGRFRTLASVRQYKRKTRDLQGIRRIEGADSNLRPSGYQANDTLLCERRLVPCVATA